MIYLIFPPSVSSGLGCYYPASAVLAGYLQRFGHATRQLDLNFEFACFLLQNPELMSPQPEEETDHIRDVVFVRKYADDLLAEIRRGAPWALSPVATVFRKILRRIESEPRLSVAAKSFYDSTLSNLSALFGAEDVVGITIAMGPQLSPAIEFVQALRSRGSLAKIVLGGPVVTLLDDSSIAKVLRTSGADLAIRHEGETPLLQLAEHVAIGRWDPSSISNAVWIEDGSLAKSSASRGVLLAEVPAPLYDDQLVHKQSVDTLSAIQARGCYWGRCAYCDYINLYGGQVRYQTVHPERLASDLDELSTAHGITQFTLVTEALPPSFANKFSDALISRGAPYRWSSFAMVHDAFTDELFRKMVRAGCAGLVIGLESLSAEALKRVRKFATREANLRFVEAARRAGIKLRINLIPDLPGTSFVEAMSAADIYDNWRLSDAITFSVFPFEVTRSSDVGKNPEEFGLIAAASDEVTLSGQALFTENHVDAIDPAMTDAERTAVLERYQKLAVYDELTLSNETIHSSRRIYWVEHDDSTFVFSRRYGCLQERPVTWGLCARMYEEDSKLFNDAPQGAEWFFDQIKSDLANLRAI